MTVKELKEILDDLIENKCGDLEVCTEYDYGDRCHTRALNFVRGADVSVMKESAYSQSGWAVDDEEESEKEFLNIF